MAVLLGVALMLSACSLAIGAGQPSATPTTRSAADAYNAAVALTYSGKCRQALPVYLEALTKNPMYVNAYSGLGTCYQALGSFNEAIAEYDKAIQIDPTGYGLYMARAGAEYNNGSGGSALADLNTALRLAPPQAVTYASIAAAFDSYTDFVDAVKAYTLAIQKVPSNPSFYEQRAQVYLQMQDATHAYADYQTAIRVSSTLAVRATIYSDLAGAYQGQGDYAHALAAVRRALQLLPNTARFYATAGDIQRDAGDYTPALGAYDRALRLIAKGPDAERAHEGKGDVFARLGRQTQAIAQYRQALKLVASSDTTTRSRVQGKITSVQSGQS